MNVNDVLDKEGVENKLDFIFDRQLYLKNKYHPIETASLIGYGLVEGPGWNHRFDINNKLWQYLLKDFAWRVTEELAECLDCNIRDEKQLVHAQEELSDALHFLVELFIIVGITPEDFSKEYSTKDPWKTLFSLHHNEPLFVNGERVNYAILKLIGKLGMAMNCLKQKPWKQTHFETDFPQFKDYLLQTLQWWISTAVYLGMGEEMAFQIYFKKSEVNKFRQRSKY